MIEKAQAILKRQKTVLLGVIGASIMFMGTYYLIAGGGYEPPASSSSKAAISLPGDKVNHQEIWMNQIEAQNKKHEAQNQLLEQKLNLLQELILDQKKKEQEIEIEKSDLKREIHRLKQDIKNISEKTEQTNNLQSVAFNTQQEQTSSPQEKGRGDHSFIASDSFSFTQDPFYQIGNSANQNPSPMDITRPPLSEAVMEIEKSDPRKQKVEPIEGRIFAGTTVKALLVSSVDAVCGVFSNSDPTPVKLRILDDGHLPKHLTAKLKGGLIIGSAFGNLSNERVYIRLERMSLFNPKGEGIEMEVAGYVSGEDGRFGLRGTVIDKSTKIIKNAAFSGFLSGTGQILQSAVSKRPVDCWNNYAVGTDILKQGCATGAGNAFDMLADYYIRRAEQVQPVLQVNAGRIVDITFTYGTSLGDLHVKEQIKECRKRSRQRE
ncbi:TraB/VirB10 family protein [Candidatus Protochlamydia phocaeensis]|uniref:TraB/VirB10 family protein n=1 Tax=Candidatus Protochlamydia phocaeensis TaxID=1414722 RepID=UPI000838A24E|nr:TraB/VirB10 family protein [Candidatus Protochlamydia phocaeensis]